MSTDVLNRHTALQERIDRAKEMVRRAEAACQALVFGESTLGELDVDGTIRRSVRALLPLAAKTPGFDVTISLGVGHSWGVRLHNDENSVDVAAVCLRTSSQHPQSETEATTEKVGLEQPMVSVAADVVTELADMLRG